jgi:AcrR family transcriptional regulator
MFAGEKDIFLRLRKEFDNPEFIHTYVSYKRMSPSRDPLFFPLESEESHCATRVAILDAAERLFSENGVDGTSVRDIIGAAKVNLGAINYHFGSKERLMLEVFARRLEPVNRERIARLDALEASAGTAPLKLEQIVDALIRPAMESEDDGGAESCDNFMRLISRCFQEPNPELKKFVEEQFAHVCQRFDAAILRAAPGLSSAELFWRMKFLFGALNLGLQVWVRFDLMPQPHGIDVVKPDREGLIQRLILFAVGGLSAPMPNAN